MDYDVIKDRAYQRARQNIKLAEEPREEMIRDYSEFKKPAHVPYKIWVEECAGKIIKKWMKKREERK